MKVFVPGRLCLFGEHSDWAEQYRQLNPDFKPGYAVDSTKPVLVVASLF